MTPTSPYDPILKSLDPYLYSQMGSIGLSSDLVKGRERLCPITLLIEHVLISISCGKHVERFRVTGHIWSSVDLTDKMCPFTARFNLFIWVSVQIHSKFR